MRQFWRNIVVGAVIVSMFTSFSWGSVSHAESKKKLNNKLNNIEKKQDKSDEKLSGAKDQLEKNKEKQKDKQAKIDQIKSKISTTKKQITDIEDTIANNKADISRMKKQIKSIKKRIKKRTKILKDRIKSMYINGGSVDYLSVLLGSNNFGEFLDRVFFLNKISDQDKKIIKSQKEDKAEVEKQQASIQKKLKENQSKKASLESLNSQLSDQKAEQKRLMKKLEEEQGHIEKMIMTQKEKKKTLEGQEAAVRQLIKEAKQREQRRKANKQNNSPSKPEAYSASSSDGGGNGMFIWPAGNRGAISDYYGARGGTHKGIDIAVNGAVKIKAAQSGVVARAYHSSSYGNVAFINHRINGNIYTTVYAHMRSRPMVSKGQKVQQGQQIGWMGSTGQSTGQHLHFEIYKGQWTPPPHPGTVNPLNYLP
ncbi:murein hydrolase activator EnvC family protein [Tuberibacillus sp. Marseille-P3662]|uniref:murein hydrolase activator EnvC family protein n=1 Tax=Tuberibacillus sp. Marseille-P3662 TaxID=1965358 RepID=UPI000A1CE2A8|nr:M23 family metallopeptidase [Tuberibacillus sp. Marseille-P3662]